MDDDKRAFLEFERSAYAGGAQAYADWAAPKTTQVLPYLLDAAGVEAGHVVLDLATGPGFGAAAAADRGATAIGLDISAEMIEIARSTYPEIDFRVAEAESLPIEDASTDAIVSAFGLPHFADHHAVFAECNRVLKPGGRLAMSTHAPPERSPMMQLFFGGFAALGDTTAGDLPPGESPFAYADPKRCQRDLGVAGFDQVVVEEVELLFLIDGPDDVMRYFTEIGGRPGALFSAQTNAVKHKIRDYVEEAIAPYAAFDRPHRVPLTAVVITARA